MTTICYKDGIIAYDSQVTAGQTIVDYSCDKRKVVDGVSFFITGKPAHFNRLIDSYFGKGVDFDNLDLEAIVYDGKLWLVSIVNEKYHIEHIGSKPYAIGSGQDHAWTAMDLGCSAKEAVKMAILRDTGTGGRVRQFKVKL